MSYENAEIGIGETLSVYRTSGTPGADGRMYVGHITRFADGYYATIRYLGHGTAIFASLTAADKYVASHGQGERKSEIIGIKSRRDFLDKYGKPFGAVVRDACDMYRAYHKGKSTTYVAAPKDPERDQYQQALNFARYGHR